MGLTDSVKQQAGQAWGTVQQGLGQGQARFEEFRAKNKASSLLRNLGAAYYAQQREGGSEEAVTEALAAMDQHVEEHRPRETAANGAASTDDADKPEIDSGPAPQTET